ncbi:outer membrane protein assembly factor BamE [Yoonia sp. R2331]|uniref:outer membrane protein assembly factor BamE n=1 Tax=Yoonia sp. R2331 TaxID=3237238 RepID=UPI0034E4580E
MKLGLSARMRSVMALGVLILAVACNPVIRNHGFIPFQEDLDRIVIGQDSREAVAQLVGPPSAGGVPAGGDYYYVASKFRHYGAVAPVEISREVLAIRFDSAGVVRNIERFGLEDGRVIVLSRRVTDDNIADTTFIRQLLGNIGRVNAADFIGEN